MAIALSLALVAGSFRWKGLDPSDLWLDDTWQALVWRADTFREVSLAGLTSKGFAFLLKGWFSAFGFSVLKAQALPLIFGVAAPAIFYLRFRRQLPDIAALVGAALLVFSPLHATYSTRVKPYTLAALITISLMVLTYRIIRRPDERGSWRLLLASSVLGTVMSSALVPVIAASFAASGIAALRARTLSTAARYPAGYVVFGLFWYVLVLAPTITDRLRGYWSGYYLDFDEGLRAGTSDLLRTSNEFAGGFSSTPPLLVWICIIAGVGFLARRQLELAVLTSLPLLMGVLLALAHLAPFGGGRSDVYLYPAVALLFACVIGELIRARRPLGLGVAAATMIAVVATLAPLDPYPAIDTNRLVSIYEGEKRTDDVIALESKARWGYALYTNTQVDLVPATTAAGFDAVIRDDNVFVLSQVPEPWFAYVPKIKPLTAAHERIWLFTLHRDGARRQTQRAMRTSRLRLVSSISGEGATLQLWRKT